MAPPKRATLRDVATAAGVSVPQASLAMNGQGRVATATMRRVRDAADRLGYRPDPAARALRSGSTDAVGLLTRNLSNPYFLDVLRGMEAVTSGRGSHIVMMDSGYDAASELEAVQRMADSRVSGLAIAPVGGTVAVDWWTEHQPGIPIVLLNVSPFPGVATVGPDCSGAVTAAVDHLAELGHTRVGYVAAPAADDADPVRSSTFIARCRERRIQPEVLRARLSFDAVRELVAAELDSADGVRAFVMNSDYTASAVYRAARDAGMEVGRDVSVVGHDDLPTSSLLSPAMTTIGFDRRSIGTLAAEVLFDPRRQPRDLAVGVRLMARDSVAVLTT